MSLYILCIRFKKFFWMFWNSNLRSWVILVNTSVLWPNSIQIVHRLSQSSLFPSRQVQINIIYLINGSVDWVLITLTFVALDNYSFGFLSWVPITCIWIEFVPIGLRILCIRLDLFLTKVFRSQPHNLGYLGQHFYASDHDVSN